MALATPVKTNNKNSITWIENKVKISSQVLLTKAFIKYHINIFWGAKPEVMNKINDAASRSTCIIYFKITF